MYNHICPQVQIALSNRVANPMFVLPANGLLVRVTVRQAGMEFYDGFPVLTVHSKVGVRHAAR